MNQGRIIVITGSPGTGKTTTASIVAKESDMDKSVHMHTDDFFHYLSKGAIPPHLPESNKQNLVVIEAFLEAAKRYARGGYDVIVDGIVGPWFLEPWKALAQEDYEVHYMLPVSFARFAYWFRLLEQIRRSETRAFTSCKSSLIQ